MASPMKRTPTLLPHWPTYLARMPDVQYYLIMSMIFSILLAGSNLPLNTYFEYIEYDYSQQYIKLLLCL